MRHTVAGLAACLIAASCTGDPPLHVFFRAQKLPLIFAHRGGGSVEPEETVPTFLGAWRRNHEAVIEFDVLQTRDGQIVVLHDTTVDRTTNGTGAVAALTLAEVQALDAGYCATPGEGDGTAPRGACHEADPARFPFRGKGYQIPTLGEVLAALPLEAFFSVEVKKRGIEKQVADVLRASGRLDHMIVGAEFDDISIPFKAALPEPPHYYPEAAGTCLALTAKIGWSYAACPQYDALASPLSGAGLALDTRAVIRNGHAEAAAVIYWTINTESEMERLFRLGADGIYTDYPDQALGVLTRLRAEGALP